MNRQKVDRIVLGVSGILFIVGGVIHWLILFGVIVEKAPFLVGTYFHSLAVFSMIAGIGLVRSKNWGIQIAIVICVTQIPAHLYMIYLDSFKGWNSGYGVPERVVDLALVSAFIIYIACRKTFLNRKAD